MNAVGRGDRRFRGAVGAGVGAVAVVWLVVTVRPGGETAYSWVSNLTQIFAPLAAVVGAWRAASRTRSTGWRLGWILIGASALCWALGSLFWAWYELIEGTESPFPSAADVGFLASVPLAVAGLLCFPSHARRLSARTRTLLDALVVAGSVLFVSWVFVLGPQLQGTTGPVLERVIGVAYPAADAVLLTIVIVVAARAGREGRTSLAFVAAGFGALAVADSVFVYTSANDLAASPLSDTGWFAGYLLISLGAYYALRHTPRPTTIEEQPGKVALLLPYVPLAAVLVVAAGTRLRYSEFHLDAPEFWIGLVLITLLLTRQALVLLDNANLTRSLASSMASLEHQALHDPLTDLPNRGLFLDRLQVALARASREHQMLAVMFLDLDQFKPVNDLLGHRAGDQVLVAVADRLPAVLRLHDTVARFGGDEFLVLCPDLESVDQALAIARRLNEAVAVPIMVAGTEAHITCSIGLVLTDSGDEDPAELLRLADATMYRAKHAGKDHARLLDRTLLGPRPSPVSLGMSPDAAMPPATTPASWLG